MKMFPSCDIRHSGRETLGEEDLEQKPTEVDEEFENDVNVNEPKKCSSNINIKQLRHSSSKKGQED